MNRVALLAALALSTCMPPAAYACGHCHRDVPTCSSCNSCCGTIIVGTVGTGITQSCESCGLVTGTVPTTAGMAVPTKPRPKTPLEQALDICHEHAVATVQDAVTIGGDSGGGMWGKYSALGWGYSYEWRDCLKTDKLESDRQALEAKREEDARQRALSPAKEFVTGVAQGRIK